jgi:exosortase
MATTAPPAAPIGRGRSVDLNLVAIVLAFCALAYSTVRTLAGGLWQTDDHAFAPIVLVMAIAMAVTTYRRNPTDVGRAANSGMGVMLAAVVVIAIGVLLNNIFFRSVGLLGMAIGLVIFLAGFETLRRYAYPFVACLFVLPLPGAVITAITFPMKMAISGIATKLLFVVGYPVASEGVLIDIGNYRLLVADACSGMQSMYSLIAVAVGYLFLMRIEDPRRAATLMVLTLPIVFALNVLRVVVIALLTYYFGSGVGEGFAHGVAGMTMFVLAFFALMGADRLLEAVWLRRPA